MISAKENVVIAYKGRLVDNGTMDVQDLGAALVAFGDLISESNKVLNHDNSKVAVQVNADFKRGSFEIELELFRSITEQVSSLFNEAAVPIGVIAGLIGITAFATGKQSLIEFIRWLRGRKIDKVTQEGDGHITVFVGGDKIVVNQPIINLYTSIPVRESLEKVLAPLERDGIDVFESRDSKDHNKVISSINKEEKQYFGISQIDEERTNTFQQNVFVKILNVSFEELKWRLLFGEEKIYADIKDAEFVANVRDGLISFTNGDMLNVLLEINQVAKDGVIKNSYSVIKVNEIIERPRAINLPLEN